METSLGEYLRRQRERLGITQAALAQLAQIDQGDLSKIESGRIDPRWSTAQRLLDAVGAEITAPTTRRPQLSEASRRAARKGAGQLTDGAASDLLTVKR